MGNDTESTYNIKQVSSLCWKKTFFFNTYLGNRTKGDCPASLTRRGQCANGAPIITFYSNFSPSYYKQGCQYRTGGRTGLATGTIYFGYRSIPVYRFGFTAIFYIYKYIYIYICMYVCMCLYIYIYIYYNKYKSLP